MADLSRLLKIIRLLYRMDDNDINDLTAVLLGNRQTEWRQAIQAEALGVGCKGVQAKNASGGDLAKLRDDSRKEARQIAKTWNRDIERQLKKLFDQNPRGNRNYYSKNMTAWMNARASWKNTQIALNTSQTARQYAKEQFWKKNKLTDRARFIFTGPPPTCEDCATLFSMGLVGIDVVQRYPAPRHPNCPHEWEQFTGVGVGLMDCEKLWIG